MDELCHRIPSQVVREAHYQEFRRTHDYKELSTYVPNPPLTEEEKTLLTPDDLVGVIMVNGDPWIGTRVTEFFGGEIEDLRDVYRNLVHYKFQSNWEELAKPLGQKFLEVTGFTIEELDAAVSARKKALSLIK